MHNFRKIIVLVLVIILSSCWKNKQISLSEELKNLDGPIQFTLLSGAISEQEPTIFSYTFPWLQNTEKVKNYFTGAETLIVQEESWAIALLLKFKDAHENPLSWFDFWEDYDPNLAFYFQNTFFPVLYDFWIGPKGYPKLYNWSIRNLTLTTNSWNIPHYLIMKNKDIVGEIFSLPWASSYIHSFQVGKQGRRIDYEHTDRNKITNSPQFTHVFSHNGNNILKAKNWNNVFGLDKIWDQLFYFFDNGNNSIGYSFMGTFFVTPFQKIAYENCCNSPWIHFQEDKFFFFAKKDGLRYPVQWQLKPQLP